MHGQFAEHLGGCVYGGLWVGPDSPIPNDAGLRLDVLTALRRLRVPVLRWPGGCFADDYHWPDGVGPDRPRRFNAWWGHEVDDNRFGTHEFLRLCRLIGAKPYLAGNVGSGSPGQLKDWVEYCCWAGDTTFARRRGAHGHPEPYDVRYWGVGNESWGCGGSMTAAEYAGHYNRFSTYLGTFARPPTNLPLYLIAAGPNRNDLDWTAGFFDRLAAQRGDAIIHGYGAHYYAGTAGTATAFTAEQWYQLLHSAAGVEGLIVEQRRLMDALPAAKQVDLILDEWGTWHPPTVGTAANHLWQQNTLRDAVVAAVTLDTFHRHADKLVMANIAQVANVLQAMVLTDGGPHVPHADLPRVRHVPVAPGRDGGTDRCHRRRGPIRQGRRRRTAADPVRLGHDRRRPAHAQRRQRPRQLARRGDRRPVRPVAGRRDGRHVDRRRFGRAQHGRRTRPTGADARDAGRRDHPKVPAGVGHGDPWPARLIGTRNSLAV